jgi:septum formation protein
LPEQFGARADSIRFILASKSPARLKLLREAGLNPEVLVSAVDEDAVIGSMPAEFVRDAVSEVALLAGAKARAVLDKFVKNNYNSSDEDILILGLDSLYEFQGNIWGKPHEKLIAIERIKQMSGESGQLHTGHHAILARTHSRGVVERHEVTSTQINFAHICQEEIEAYVNTTEPLEVAGSFTIDSLGSAFIESISGDYHSVVGASPHTLRKLTQQLGLNYTALWNSRAAE